MEYITSRSNPLISHIRKLIADKSYRRKKGEMVCEGPKMLEEALHWGSEITVMVQTEKTTSIINLPQKVRVVCVPEDLLRWISDTQTPQKILFLCRIPDLTLPKTLPLGNYLVLDGMQDPGNVGTIWRTADAFGANGLLLLPQCADPWGTKTIRASMGACFRLPVWEVTKDQLETWKKVRNMPLYATALREDAVDVRTVSFDQAAVVIGSEGRGVSQDVLSICDQALKIPMRDRCESLNAAVAASVILWEMAHTKPQAIV